MLEFLVLPKAYLHVVLIIEQRDQPTSPIAIVLFPFLDQIRQ